MLSDKEKYRFMPSKKVPEGTFSIFFTENKILNVFHPSNAGSKSAYISFLIYVHSVLNPLNIFEILAMWQVLIFGE